MNEQEKGPCMDIWIENMIEYAREHYPDVQITSEAIWDLFWECQTVLMEPFIVEVERRARHE